MTQAEFARRNATAVDRRGRPTRNPTGIRSQYSGVDVRYAACKYTTKWLH